jgi:hypothetical protein
MTITITIAHPITSVRCRFGPGRASRRIFHLDVLVPMPRAAGAQPRVHEPVEIAVEHALRVARAYAGPEVLDHLIRLEDVAANLAAPPNLALLAVEFVHLGALLVLAFFI